MVRVLAKKVSPKTECDPRVVSTYICAVDIALPASSSGAPCRLAPAPSQGVAQRPQLCGASSVRNPDCGCCSNSEALARENSKEALKTLVSIARDGKSHAPAWRRRMPSSIAYSDACGGCVLTFLRNAISSGRGAARAIPPAVHGGAIPAVPHGAIRASLPDPPIPIRAANCIRTSTSPDHASRPDTSSALCPNR
jgi:hypothetical protein